MVARVWSFSTFSQGVLVTSKLLQFHDISSSRLSFAQRSAHCGYMGARNLRRKPESQNRRLVVATHPDTETRR
jgi:hypothetical protein